MKNNFNQPTMSYNYGNEDKEFVFDFYCEPCGKSYRKRCKWNHFADKLVKWGGCQSHIKYDWIDFNRFSVLYRHITFRNEDLLDRSEL